MNITKTTTNYATKRNIELCTAIEGELHIIVNPDNNDCASVVYSVYDDVLVFTEQWDKGLEDLPAHITTEKQLREAISYVSRDSEWT